MAATVTIGSKDPNKMVLSIQASATHTEPVLGGGLREVTRWFNTGKQIVLNGTGVQWGQARTHPMAHGYALTPNVPADLWAEWVKQNQGSPLLTSGVLICHAKLADVVANAKNNRELRTGLEAVDPHSKMRMGMGMEIVKSDDQPKIAETEPLADIVYTPPA